MNDIDTDASIFIAILAALYARRSAVAARESTDLARMALVATQRAFVFTPRINTTNIIDSATRLLIGIQIEPTWQNTGQTPALRLAAYIDARIIAANESFEISIEKPPEQVVRIDIGPQATFSGNTY